MKQLLKISILLYLVAAITLVLATLIGSGIVGALIVLGIILLVGAFAVLIAAINI